MSKKTYEQIEEERAKRIEKYVNDRDLNIRVSWAINNAVHIANAIVTPESTNDKVQDGIKQWAKWFLTYYEEIREQEAHKMVKKDTQEKAL